MTVKGEFMSIATLLGYFAGFLTTVSLVPQVVKTWKTKSVNDFSLGMLLIWLTGILCWVAYGILTNAEPIVVWNMSTLLLAGSILAMKIKFKNKIERDSMQILSKKPEVRVFQDWGI